MRKRLYIEIPGTCAWGCSVCPASHESRPLERSFYSSVLLDAKRIGFNWVGFCGMSPLHQDGFSAVLADAMGMGYQIRIYGRPDGDICLPIAMHALHDLQYTVVVTDEIACGMQERLANEVIGIKNRFPALSLAVKDATTHSDLRELRRLCELHGILYYEANWWFCYWDHRYGEVIHDAPSTTEQTQPWRTTDTDVCMASRNKVFIDCSHGLRACYMAKQSVANLDEVSLSDCMSDDALWGKWRTIRVGDMPGCLSCDALHTCHICPASLIETGEAQNCAGRR